MKLFLNKKRILLAAFFSILLVLPSNIFAKEAPASFADLAEKLMPSVVNISATKVVETKGQSPFPFQFPPGSPFEDFFKEYNQQQQTPQKRKSTALGSGFVISADGIVITNNHVIQGSEGIFVKFTDGKEYEAKLIGTDPVSDIAVLQIKSKNKFKPVVLADSNKSRVGDWVLAIGNPFGLGGTVTTGIISAINRDIHMGRYDNFIQTDASINMGNSGGPLFNMSGEVVGINTAIFSQSGGSVGIGFAIPSSFAKNVIEQLRKYGETRRGWLGVRIQEVTKEIADSLGMKEAIGALVADINEKSPAKKAGLKEGDVIVEFNGIKIDSMRKLPKVVAEAPVGKQATLKIWRDKKILEKTIVLGRLEDSAEFKKKAEPKKVEKNDDVLLKSLGIKVRNVNDQDVAARKLLTGKNGVIVQEVDEDGSLADSPIQVGDIIVALQNSKIVDASDFSNKLNKLIGSGNKSLLLTVIDSQNRSRYVGVKIK
jgi:serine protease Do